MLYHKSKKTDRSTTKKFKLLLLQTNTDMNPKFL